VPGCWLAMIWCRKVVSLEEVREARFWCPVLVPNDGRQILPLRIFRIGRCILRMRTDMTEGTRHTRTERANQLWIGVSVSVSIVGIVR